MKRLLPAVLFVAVSVLLVWILKQAFPKNAGALNLFLILLFLDAFLWAGSGKRIRSFRPLIKNLITLAYWLPMLLVVAGIVYGYFRSFYEWPLFLRAYVTSFIFVAYASKILPVIFFLLYLIFKGILFLVSGNKRASGHPPSPRLRWIKADRRTSGEWLIFVVNLY